jgi:hypothetical protein
MNPMEPIDFAENFQLGWIELAADRSEHHHKLACCYATRNWRSQYFAPVAGVESFVTLDIERHLTEKRGAETQREL